MKRLVLLGVLCLTFTTTFSQYNYYRLAAGGNVGANTAFADLSKKIPSSSISAGMDYYLSPFVSIGLEYQMGTLSGGDRVTDEHKRYFKNNYSSITFGTKIHLGQVIDYHESNVLYALRHLYLGAGVGMIKNSIKDANIVRVQPGTGWVFPGTNKSTGIAVPVSTGINFPLMDRWGYTKYIFNINYQLNITTGEGLDGYNDASQGKPWSNIPDMYGVASIGLKVCFGPQGLY